MDTAIFNLTHGLYVLTTRLGGRDNGCIVDAVMQASAMPQRVAVAVMKKNLNSSRNTIGTIPMQKIS